MVSNTVNIKKNLRDISGEYQQKKKKKSDT